MQYAEPQAVDPADRAAAEHRLGLYHAEVERIKREDLSVKVRSGAAGRAWECCPCPAATPARRGGVASDDMEGEGCC